MSMNSDYHPQTLIWLRRAAQTIDANIRNPEEWWRERQWLIEDHAACKGNSWKMVEMCKDTIARIEERCNPQK